MHIMQAVKSFAGKKGGKLHLKDFMLNVDRYESVKDSGEAGWSRMKQIKNQFLSWAKLHNGAQKNRKRGKK